MAGAWKTGVQDRPLRSRGSEMSLHPRCCVWDNASAEFGECLPSWAKSGFGTGGDTTLNIM